MKDFDVVVAGHVCLDIIPSMPAIPLEDVLAPGALIEVGAPTLQTGGPVSNTGRNIHRLGMRTRLCGKVGDDPFGRIVLELIRAQDPLMGEDMIVDPAASTSYTIVISPPQTDRFFMHCAGANHDYTAADVPYERLAQARLFHFGYPPYMQHYYANAGDDLVEMYRRAKEAGVITSLDMALPNASGPSGQVDWRRILERTLPYVDLFLPSLDELLFMLRRDQPLPESDPDSVISLLAEEALAMGAGLVGLKLGDRGLYVRTGAAGAPFLDAADGSAAAWRSREVWAPCFQAEPLVGTTGSGDATIAGFLVALLRGQSLEAAVTSAVGVGACNVEAADALSGVRSWEDTQDRIAAGWTRLPLAIDAPGWRWDEQHAIWRGPHDQRG